MKTTIVEVHIVMNGRRGGFDLKIVHLPEDGGEVELSLHATSVQDATAQIQQFVEKHT